MKPLAFNLKDAKKISGDKHSSTFVLKDGHQIKIAHAPLPAMQKKQLERIPVHLADGGPAAEEPSAFDRFKNDVSGAVNEAKDALPSAQDIGIPDSPFAGMPQSAPPVAQDQAAPAPVQAEPAAPVRAPADLAKPEDSMAGRQIASTPAAQPQSASSLANAAGNSFDFGSAYKQGQQGISEAEQVAKQNAEANINTYKNDVEARQELNNNFNKNIADIQNHQKQLIQDFAAGHIDPKHYQESMSTGQKVTTAIGLLLGGFTGGFNKTNINPALEYLKNQQEKDIQSQMVSMDQKKTLLGANQDLYKDAILGQQATRLNQNDMLDHQIQMQASKTGSLAAKAAADQAHAHFAFENGQLLQSMAIRKTVLDSAKNGGAGLNPLLLGRAGIMSPEQASKEQSAIDALRANINVGNGAYDNLSKLQTVKERVTSPVQSGQRIAVENAKLASIIQDADPSKRLTPETAQLEILPYSVSLKDNPETVEKKREAFHEHLMLKYAGQIPVTAQYAPASIPRYSPPPQVKTMNGAQYQKVQGGWKKVQ